MAGKLDLDAIAAFVAVADAQSFSAGARALGLPVSTVSRRVAALESALGVQLLHRTTRKVSLTGAGTELHRRVAPVIAGLRAAVERLPEQEEEPSGLLRVTAPVDIGGAFVADLATRFIARHPGVQLEIHLSNEVTDLVKQGYDLALRVSGARLKPSSLVARKVSLMTGGLYAAPSYLARRGTPRGAADLEDHDWVIHRGAVASLRLEAPGETFTVSPRGRIVCDDMTFVRETVRAGAGLGWLPHFLPQAEVAAGQLTRVLPRHHTRSGWLWLVWPGGRHLPRKTAVFRDAVIEALRRTPLAPA